MAINGSIPNNTGTFTTEGNATLSGIIVTNSGSLISFRPGQHTLDVSGSYTQTSKGEFTTEIKASQPPGHLVFWRAQGPSARRHTHDQPRRWLQPTRGGSNFTVMTYPSETGDFRTIDHGDAGQGQFWSESTNSTDVAVTAAIDAPVHPQAASPVARH